jgi:uncharacterized protein YegL
MNSNEATAAYQMPSAPAFSPQAQAPSKEEQFRSIIFKYEISQEYAQRLQKLRDCKILFIFDDSGSMNSTLNDSPLNEMNKNSMLKATRWDELQYYASMSIELAIFFNSELNNGTDVFFLNKPPVRNIRSGEAFMHHCSQLKPGGYTPLNKIFNLVLSENVEAIRERKLLVIILTDGEPSDDYGKTDIKSFKHSLEGKHDNVFVNIITCTDDNESVSYLNKWDRQIKHLDVIDDYNSERKEIRKRMSSKYRFTYGDYVVKSLIGAVDPEMDRADEKSAEKCIIS